MFFVSVGRFKGSLRLPFYALIRRNHGRTASQYSHPQSLTVHGASRVLEVSYSDGKTFRIPFELLRVYSPSAEVQGHGPGQEVLQTGKRDVGINTIEPVGNYAIKPFFSDGHESGLYTWEYLYQLGSQQDALWQQYLQRLKRPGWIATRPCPRRAPAVMAAACIEL
jgi:DUF971 family protein